jgi:phosphatidylglycerol---prolipoprotein diacylglyceryl transferase
MHPLLFRIGSLWIPTYGVLAALAFLASMWFVRRYARFEGRDPVRTTDAVFWTIVAGVIGARVLEFAVNWRRILGTPGGLKLFAMSSGVFVGGLVAAIAFAIYWFHRIDLPVMQGLDYLAIAGAVVEGIGRWGCFFSGCCWGTPTDLPWAVTFPEIARRLHQDLPAVPLHPTQIYMSINAWAIFGVLALLYRRKRFHGQIVTVYVGLYSVTRFFMEFVRGDAERGFVLGGLLSTSQFASVLLLAGACAAYALLARRARAGAPLVASGPVAPSVPPRSGKSRPRTGRPA